MSSNILLVEDEPGLVLTISDLLHAHGHRVDAAVDGEAGLERASSGMFDLLILDVMLPRIDGFEVCRRLRRNGLDTAILMLTARSEVADRVAGLRGGADDYLAKPFDPVELLARVDALLRRIQKQRRDTLRTFQFGDVHINFDRAELSKSGRPVNIATKELQLLQYLIDHSGMIIGREEILQNVWQYSPHVSSRTIDVHVAWLRQKLEDNPQNPKHIHTIRGKGYRFSP